MTLATVRRSPVRRQLEAYKESWRPDHEALKECWAWEDTISVGLSCFALIEEVTEAWRTRVFRGTEAFSEEDNEFYAQLYEFFVEVTDDVLGAVDRLQRNGTVEGAERLREAVSRARQTRKDWVRLRIAQAIGLREMTLTPEAAAELDRILEAAKANPPPMPTGPKMQMLSPAEFLALPKRS